MAEITANLVKQLRERTGAGMMECKKRSERSEGRPRRSRSRSSQARHRVRRQEGLPHHQTGRRSAPISTPARSWASWSKLTASPISWPAPKIFRSWFRISPCRSPPPIPSSCGAKMCPAKRSKKRRKSRRPAPSPKASRRRSPRKSSKAAWRSSTKRCASYEQPFVKENTLTVEQVIKTKIAKLGENIIRFPVRPLQGRRFEPAAAAQ